MEQLIDIFRFFSISLLILLVTLFIRSGGKRGETLAASLFGISIIGYLIVDWPPLEGEVLFFVFLFAAFCLPFSFWLFSKALFDDDFHLKPWWFGVLTLVVLMDYLIYFQNHGLGLELSDSQNALVRLLHHVVALVFIVMGIVEAAKNRKEDLIVSRFQFRYILIWLSATIIGLTILTEVAFPEDNPPLFLELLQKAVIFGLTLFFILNRVNFKPGFFQAIPDSKTPSATSEANKGMITHLLKLMEEDEIYKTEGLSIRQLAEIMNVKEYRLRQTINQHLGFRNFNEFLNSYRIQAACDLLTDPQKQDLTVLEIAYDLGYNSLAPFNKSFKQITGMTPTLFRKESHKTS